MDRLAILITQENCHFFSAMLRESVKTPNGYRPDYWIGYYLVVVDGVPETMTATKFANSYVFAIDPTMLMPIRPR